MGDKGVTQGSNRRPVQIRKERKDGFTAEKKQDFLDHLAGCSNVSRAAAAVGFSAVTVNYHRRRDPVFAQACADALAAGYVALEASLLERAARGGRYEPGPGAEDAPGAESVDIGLGQFLLGLRAREMGQRTGVGSGPRPQRATEKELNESLLAKLKLLGARRTRRGSARGGRGMTGFMTGDERALLRTVRRVADLVEVDQRSVLRQLSMPEKRTLDEFWPAWLHAGQAPPAGDWPVWLMLTGRGFGKTRAGAEWVSALARADGGLRIALVGATIEDAVKVMVTGQSGVLRVARTGERPVFRRREGVVRFASGAEAWLYSGACPEKLRGPEHHVAWCDEIAKWRHPVETWDNLQLGLRLGPNKATTLPRTLVTTTPRAVPLLRRLAESAAVTRGRTADNPHLPAAWVARMEAEYRGTRKGREELDGELLGEAEGALWSRALIEACRGEGFAGPADAAGGRRFARIAVAVDPPATAAGDACGIVACAVTADGVAHVIGDHSVRGASPEGWSGKVAAAAAGWGADVVVVERNQGGDMAKSVLLARDAALPVREVFARFGKGDRAEPVAMLFETGKARFAGRFPELEDELCAMTAAGFAGGGSPDRADAMVWAMSHLMLGVVREPRVRGL